MTRELTTDRRYTATGFHGIALHLVGPEQVWEPYTTLMEDDEGNEWEEPIGEGEWVDGDGSRVVVVMVGDDREHTVDAEDLQPIDDDDYCSECGQIGCGWS